MSIDLNYITIVPAPGGNTCFSRTLAFKTIIQVSREGRVCDLVPGTPAVGTRQVKKLGSFGGFLFDAPFNPGETVYIKYR
jgi:hypothetical protein